MATSKSGKSSGAATIQTRAAALEAELSAIRQLSGAMTTIKRVKRDFPQVFEGFKAELHGAIDAEPAEEDDSDQSTESIIAGDESGEYEQYGVEKLVSFFKARNNKPASVAEMATGVGRSERTIKSILYHRYRGKFETMEQRGRNNKAYFRLAEK